MTMVADKDHTASVIDDHMTHEWNNRTRHLKDYTEAEMGILHHSSFTHPEIIVWEQLEEDFGDRPR